MAQTGFKLHQVSHQSPADLAHKQLEVEKVGVIAGFLAGLPLAVGTVQEVLNAHGAPEWLVGLAMIMTVAATTSVGLRVGAAIAGLLGKRN
jgi:hypothetical protein